MTPPTLILSERIAQRIFLLRGQKVMLRACLQSHRPWVAARQRAVPVAADVRRLWFFQAEGVVRSAHERNLSLLTSAATEGGVFKQALHHHLATLYDVPVKVLNQAVRRNRERFPDDFRFQIDAKEFANLKSQFVTSNTRPALRSQIVTLKRGQNIKYRPYAFTEQGVAMLSSVLRSDRAVQVNIEIMRAFVRLRQWLSSHADLARKLAALENKYDAQFKVVFDALRQLMAPPCKPRREIGFHTLGKPTAKETP